MATEVYVFKEGSIKRQMLLEKKDLPENSVYMDFNFININGERFPLFLEVESEQEKDAIKDVSVVFKL